MSLDTAERAYPNIVPENNLRLPDAVTITHGPTRLLARFILEADQAARRIGLFLRIRHDFEELVFLNRREAARGNWYPIVDMFNSEHVDLNAENAFWVSGENGDGEIVATFGVRIFDWRGTNLAQQARALFYGEDHGQPCIVTAEAAHRISGIVVCGGVNWVRPDYRGHQLSRLTPRIGKAYACGRWPVDWAFGLVSNKHAKQGMPAYWGHPNCGYSISYPGTPWVDLGFAYSSAQDIYEDITNFLATQLSEDSSSRAAADVRAGAEPAGLEHIVTKTSSDGVFHGSKSRS